MLNIAEYRRRADRLADHLPWAALVAPGIILNKDGSFQRSIGFRGPDLDSATEAELVAACARANNMLKRFGSGWALFFEAERVAAGGYPASDFPDASSWLVDAERRASFESRERQHFESHFHLTLVWMPPADQADSAGRALIERPEAAAGGRDWREALARFEAESLRAIDLMATFMPEVRALGDSETLTYLHRAISPHRHRVRVPATPMYLDALLADTPLTGGLEPMLGDEYLRTLTILGFPSLSRPGIFDALNAQDFAYRWTTRFIALDKADATAALTRLRRQWFNKRKSLSALLREVMYNQPAQLLDSDANNKVVDADAALQALGGDHVSFGYLTTTITVADRNRARAEEKLRGAERIVHSLGFTAIRESVNAVEAWLSSLPGHVYANVRQPLVHSLNLAHLMPLSALWAGPARNPHLGGPPLLMAETGGSTPFRLSTHVGDVGHMMIAGPTGAGKSVLLALIALQFRRYRQAQLYIFDKGNSARAAVLAMGGRHHALGHGDESLSFQPLRGIDRAEERSWAADWIVSIVAHEGVAVTPEIKDAIWSALTSLASAPASERTLTGLSLLLQSNALKSALQPFTLEGPHGRLLDAAEEGLALGSIECFETEALMGQGQVVEPVLSYLFHRLEARFDGKPTLLILDEAWIFLDNPLFAARIREWLKVLRKKNVAVIFATQSLADIAGSTIAPAIIESCPQRILLPNDRAVEPQSRAAYAAFGLNDAQIELIARAAPKRQYYLQSSRGNRLFELGLGPVALALCGASDPAAEAGIDAILAEHGEADFASHWLRGAGLDWAADLLAGFPGPFPTDRPAPPRRRHAMKILAPMMLAAAAVPALLFASPPAAAMPVFDQANYSQNLLTAARTLKQIDQQIRQLQNEAQMLSNMDKHLKRVDFPELQALKDNLARVDALMERAEGIDFGVDQLDARMAALFPKDFAGMTRSASVAQAKARLEAAMASYRRTLAVQSRIAADVKEDAAVLAEVAARSTAAEGSLQVSQATNQLLVLAAKQQMQLQQMMAAAYEADMLDRTRAAQSAAEARERMRRFLGDGKAYTPIR